MIVNVMKKLYRWGMYNFIYMLFNIVYYIDLFGYLNILDYYDIIIRRNIELVI